MKLVKLDRRVGSRLADKPSVVIVLVLLALVAAAVLAACAQPAAQPATPTAKPAEEKFVDIAVMWPFSGPVRVAGLQNLAVLQAAIDEVNKAGGVTLADGTKAKLRYAQFDTACKPAEALAVFPKVAAGPYLMAIGPLCSSEAEPVFGLLQRKLDDKGDTGYQIPLWSETAVALGLGAISDWAFRMVPNEAVMNYETLKWLKEKYGAKTIAFGHENNFAHGVSTYKHTLESAKALGLEVLTDVEFGWLDTEFSTQVAEWRRANADIFAQLGHDTATCGIVKEMQRQGYAPKVVIGITSLAVPQALDNCGDALQGWYVPTAFAAITPEGQRVEKLVLTYPNGDRLNMSSAAVWEIVMAVRDIFPKAKIVGKPDTLQTDRRLLRDAIANIGTWQALIGTQTQDPVTGDPKYKRWALTQAKGKRWDAVEGVDLDPGPAVTLKRWGVPISDW